MIRKTLFGILAGLVAFTAIGQSVPNGGLSQGQVWTVPQWLIAWQSKADTTAVATLNGIVTKIPAGDIWCNGTGGIAYPTACNTLPFILSIAAGGNGTATPTLTAGANVTIAGSWPNYTISASGGGSSCSSGQIVGGAGACYNIPLPVAEGGTGTVTPGIVAGSNITVTGTWPNQTVTSTGGSPPGQLVVTPTGTASTDLANLNAAIATLAASVRTPPTFAQASPVWTIYIAPGTLNITSGNINILGSSTTKTQGVQFAGTGRGPTTIYFNPASAAPLFINNYGLNVQFKDLILAGGSACPDFLWSQEQAGISNVQDYELTNITWQGCWNKGERLTGGNNNSEWKFFDDYVSGTMKDWVYIPPQVTTTITSGSSTIAATINNEEIESGDTGFLTSACAPLSANTQYYVRPGATTSGFTLSTTAGGAAVSFTASCTPSFQTGNDQFLNFWFVNTKFWTGTSQSQWINMAYGGSIKIVNADVSDYAPASTGACLFNLGTPVNNGVHNSGVENFSVDGIRIEYRSTNGCKMISNWWRGSIVWNNVDESSQAGNWPATNVYDTYNLTQNGGPTVRYTNSQLMGKHAYVIGSSDYAYQSAVSYDTVTLYDNPTFANFISLSGSTNTGGYPVIDCDHCRNNQVSTTVGYTEIVDTTLNWQYSFAALKTRTAPCLGAASNWPTGGGNIQVRLPLNAAITQFRWWKAAGSGNTNAYNYGIQTTEGTPTVISGPYSGTASSSAIALQTTYGANGSVAATSTPFVMTTDAARTIEIIDNAGRSGAFGSGLYCLIDYIGDNLNILPPANDDDLYDAMRKVA